ncbi:MAG TPA: SDR family oxidoreductase [Candidatus Acidoferrales bacterium]|nr:SDR family oxidoreductase [Candidatus Acidoferrales bacterium]
MDRTSNLILLTGATGYVGGHLLSELEKSGHSVRCVTRNPDSLAARHVATTTVVAADLTDAQSLRSAMAGVKTAYYLVHSMNSNAAFEEEDRKAALAFAAAACDAGVKKIIYLGGLASGESLSSHLRSRQEVGKILRESGTPTIEFRASIIIGPGSFSFEMIRALVERLPVMIMPQWVKTPTQPIAIEDVIAYLLAGLDLQIKKSRVVEIGGSDQVSYKDLLREYAKQRGMRRLMIPVPVLSPRLSSLWLGLVTPVFARIGRELVDGLRNETVVRDPSALQLFSIRPRGFRESIECALLADDQHFARKRWSNNLSRDAGKKIGERNKMESGSRLIDSRTMHTRCPPEKAFLPVEQLGGAIGWYYGDWLWTLRGVLDRAFGGVGMQRGRRDPARLLPGDKIDCWRVEAVEQGRLLRLVAEMRVPGRAWLQFEFVPDSSGTQIHQTAIFDPSGLLGRLYWYLLIPIHQLLFQGMLRSIVESAEQNQ